MSESILADRSAIWLGRRCPKAIPAEVLHDLDSAHPWVLSEDLEQIGLRVLGLDRFPERRWVAEQRDEPS